MRVQATAFNGDKPVGRIIGKPNSELLLRLHTLRLWSPENPFLYKLKIELKKNEQIKDEVKSYFGMRKIEIAKDEKGINRIMLNGKFLMEVGPLDQGFWPDGIYTAPTDEALKYDIQMEKKLGFNLVRKHVKVEPDRWYYWADKLGMLVWQDMPSAITPSSDSHTPGSKQQFEAELERLVLMHRNHPSIVMWIVFNEGWGEYDGVRLTNWVKKMDPSRLVDNASGGIDMNVGDVSDIHSYPKPKAPPLEMQRAGVLGEFGGLGMAVPGHMWQKEHWGYRGMKDSEQLTNQYERFMQRVYQLKDSAGLSAALYTQITDVETECNGLMTYDRAVVKPELARIAKANHGDFSSVPPPPKVNIVLPSSEKEGQAWSFTFEIPEHDWFKPDFDDRQWKVGHGGFGSNNPVDAFIRSDWSTTDIWIRRQFTLKDLKTDNLFLWLYQDKDAEVYLNGVLATKVSGWSMEYWQYDISPEAKAALRIGNNVIAIHCQQENGGGWKYIDAGLVEVMSQDH